MVTVRKCPVCSAIHRPKASICSNVKCEGTLLETVLFEISDEELAARGGFSEVNEEQSAPLGPNRSFRRTTTPRITVLIAAVGLLVAFFLPWFQLFGFGISGYGIARLGSYGNLAWAIPLLAGTTIVRSLTGHNARLIGMITGIVPIAGTVSFLYLLAQEVGAPAGELLEGAVHLFSIGAYLTIILGVVMLVTALSPRKALLPDSADLDLTTQREASVREERDCPWCAERILQKARICRFCGRKVSAQGGILEPEA